MRISGDQIIEIPEEEKHEIDSRSIVHSRESNDFILSPTTC